MIEGSGGGVIGLDPLGHPHVGNEMSALGEHLVEFPPVEQRLLRLRCVEGVRLRRQGQVCGGGGGDDREGIRTRKRWRKKKNFVSEEEEEEEMEE